MTEGRRSGSCEDGVSADRHFRVLRFFGALTALDLVDLLQTPSPTHALDGVTLFDICDATFDMGYRDEAIAWLGVSAEQVSEAMAALEPILR